jgi:hypothetical protein
MMRAHANILAGDAALPVGQEGGSDEDLSKIVVSSNANGNPQSREEEESKGKGEVEGKSNGESGVEGESEDKDDGGIVMDVRDDKELSRDESLKKIQQFLTAENAKTGSGKSQTKGMDVEEKSGDGDGAEAKEMGMGMEVDAAFQEARAEIEEIVIQERGGHESGPVVEEPKKQASPFESFEFAGILHVHANYVSFCLHT